MTCPLETLIGAYTLATLEPADRVMLTEHLPTCPSCQTVLEQMAGLPGLLALVPRDQARAGHPSTDDRMYAQLRTAALTERRRHRTRLLAAAAAAALVLGLAGAGLTLALRGGDSDHTGRLVAAARGPVHARVWIHPATSGTELTLELSGVAPEERCRLVAIDSNGQRQVAATWEATYAGSASIRGSTAVPATRLARLVIETFDDRVLLDLPVSQ